MVQAVRQSGVQDQHRSGLRNLSDGPAGCPAAVVHQEDRLKIGLDSRVERQTVADRASHGVLVRQHDVVLGRRQVKGAHEAALHVSADVVGLLVDVQRRLVIRP